MWRAQLVLAGAAALAALVHADIEHGPNAYQYKDGDSVCLSPAPLPNTAQPDAARLRDTVRRFCSVLGARWRRRCSRGWAPP